MATIKWVQTSINKYHKLTNPEFVKLGNDGSAVALILGGSIC